MDTQAISPDTINLITDNLRDRYANGFPILKELIQNADDAKAQRLTFSRHPGFPEADHPLLRGPGIWFFNDGQFKPSDKLALCKFGINSKAGDAATIGKFGLGMKSVFHLCEVLFYVAFDGQTLHNEALNPWKTINSNTRPDWDDRKDSDWLPLQALGQQLAGPPDQPWFLLWIPLRRKAHLTGSDGIERGAIIGHFPGDDASRDLDFLCDQQLRYSLSEVLPLLRHLDTIEYRDADYGFHLHLSTDGRLLDPEGTDRVEGQVLDEQQSPLLRFSGLRRNDAIAWASALKNHPHWPKVRYRDEYDHERIAPDKTRPEAAILFCQGNLPSRGHLNWTVFLPLEEGKQRLQHEDHSAGHSLILHGQFFVDAGRRKVHDQEGLHEPPIRDPSDEATLRQTWNRRLAQQVLAPAIIPALEHYVQTIPLKQIETGVLTRALQDSNWFRAFRPHACAKDAWIRVLTPKGPQWQRMYGDDRQRLRPLPVIESAPERPWVVFPRLSALKVIPFDSAAPILSDRKYAWQEAELHALLAEVAGLFRDNPSMDYLEGFLADCASPFLQTEPLQHQLVALLREAMAGTDHDGRKKFAEKAKRLIQKVNSTRRLDLANVLPESLLRALWSEHGEILLVPKELETKDASAAPDAETRHAWLKQLDQAIRATDGPTLEPSLRVAQGLLPKNPEERGRFLRTYNDLRIIAVRDPLTGKESPASMAEIQQVLNNGCLFGFAQGIQSARFGLTPLLARALPEASIRLVLADDFRLLFPNHVSLPSANDGKAILYAVGHYTKRLGGFSQRRMLLEEANDPGKDRMARLGLRYLLHGSLAHREEEQATLWFPKPGEHSAWLKLWSQLHPAEAWSQINPELAGTLPTSRYAQVGIQVIDAPNLIQSLQNEQVTITSPTDFAQAEREQILSAIHEADLWRSLPLHTDINGQQVMANGHLVFLIPTTDFTAIDSLTAAARLIPRSNNRQVATQQQEWLKPLDNAARIDLALDTSDRASHAKTILDALQFIDLTTQPDLRHRLHEKAWLPTRSGFAVNPEDVIELSSFGLADDVRRLTSEHQKETGNLIYTVAETLAPWVIDHPAWGTKVSPLCSSDVKGLEKLALLLEELPRYHLGTWVQVPKLDEIELLAACSELPGFTLLARIEDRSQANVVSAWNWLKDGLARKIQPERIVQILAWLSQSTSKWKTRKGIFDQYLKWLKDESGIRSLFDQFRLASISRTWQSPKQLCAGAHGIQAEFVLDADQARILDTVIQRTDLGHSDGEQLPLKISCADFDAVLGKTPSTLASYFRAWEGDYVPAPMIGVLLGLMGSSNHLLAEQFLQGRPLDVLLNELTWAPIGGDPLRTTWMDGLELPLLMNKIQVAVQIPEGNCVEVPNLHGDWISVPIAEDLDSLLIGSIHWAGGYRALIQLRPVDPNSMDESQLIQLLRATAEVLYAGFYNQPPTDFSGLWQDLGRSDQIEINVARHLILEHIPVYLREISTDHPGIAQALSLWDQARRRVAEVETKQGDAVKERRALKKSVEALATLVEQDSEASSQVLAGVKCKLNEFQYSTDSVPFELFQNADDAAVELLQIEAFRGNDKLPEAARRMVIEIDEKAVRFLHWGRPINARGPADFDGEARGFGRDLEKMLTRSSSDKARDDRVTGKFGLGFKSTLLACTRPRILSGRLAVEIVGGMLPQPTREHIHLREALQRHADPTSRLIGTVIELPDLQHEDQVSMLGRFRALAGILCVFARELRDIRVETRESDQSFTWRAHQIAADIEHGAVALSAPAGRRSSTEAICIRVATGAVLFALGPEGFRPLPKSIPCLWVTTPLRTNSDENDGLGFACTAAFIPDPGRARLAGDSHENLGIARQLGSEAGESLQVLLEATRQSQDWPKLSRILNLDASLKLHDFWCRLWVDVADLSLRRKTGPASALARELTLALLQRLSANPKAVPNGLPSALQAMIDRADARYQLSKSLAVEPIVAILSGWQRFTAKYPRQNLVSEEIGKILKAGKMAEPHTLGFSALLALLNPPRVDPADARALGEICALTEDDHCRSDQTLKQSLHQLNFRTVSSQWKVAADLIAGGGQGIGKDERLRYALAPFERRLHPDYWEDSENEHGLNFFILARDRLKAEASELAQWILAASNREGQLIALRYIVSGELANEVADKIRGEGWLTGVLHDQSLLDEFEPEDIKRLQRLLASDSQIDRGLEPEPFPTSSSPIHHSLSLEDTLQRISEWWYKNGEPRERQYRKALYPSGDLDFSIDENSGRIDRSSWLTLLALGAFQSMGRTRESQHRSFIDDCQNKGWWRTFADLDPKEHPDQWMNVIEEYAESQYGDEEWNQWIAQFPKLYRFRRRMDEYVELLISINQFTKPFRLESILASKESEDFDRGGIEAPPLIRTLRVGGPLIIRELLHYGIITNKIAIPHAYAPIQRLRDWFSLFGEEITTSSNIHSILVNYLGEDEATFNGAYDIPLRLISVDEGLQHSILKS